MKDMQEGFDKKKIICYLPLRLTASIIYSFYNPLKLQKDNNTKLQQPQLTSAFSVSEKKSVSLVGNEDACFAQSVCERRAQTVFLILQHMTSYIPGVSV